MRRWKKRRRRFRNNSEAFFESLLQYDLGLSDAELAAMPYRRFVRWIAWYQVKAEKEEAAYKKKRPKPKGPGKGPPPSMMG